MVGAGYLADQGRKAGPLLTVICATVFLASGLAGVFEALLLSQEADTLAKAPVCGASAVPADCRLHLQGTVVGGYDEGSGLTPERHIDVKASSLDVLHLDSPIVGAPPQNVRNRPVWAIIARYREASAICAGETLRSCTEARTPSAIICP